MKALHIGLSGINAIDNPGPGIAVARSLKEDRELGARIFGLAYDALEPGIYMDWIVDRAFIMPYPSGDGAAYLERLGYLQREHGLTDVEMLQAVTSWQGTVFKYMLRAERHPGDPDKAGDEE